MCRINYEEKRLYIHDIRGAGDVDNDDCDVIATSIDKMYWKGEYVGGCLSVVLRASLYICTTAVLYRISFSYFLQKGPKEITVESWTYNNDASAFFI